MFMGLVSRIVNGMVESSSSVGGLGTLQCGIRASGLQYWTSMGQGNQLTKAELTHVEHWLTGRISKRILSMENIG